MLLVSSFEEEGDSATILIIVWQRVPSVLEVLVQFPVFCCCSTRIHSLRFFNIIKSFLLLLPLLRLRLAAAKNKEGGRWDGGLTPHRILTRHYLQ